MTQRAAALVLYREDFGESGVVTTGPGGTAHTPPPGRVRPQPTDRASSDSRRVLRAATRWPGAEEEKAYIRSELRSEYARNRQEADPSTVAKLLEDGARRVAISVHYGIPYSRLEHAALSGGSEAKHMAAPEHSGTTSVEAAQHSAAELRRTFARPINPMAAAARARNRERMKALKLRAEDVEPDDS